MKILDFHIELLGQAGRTDYLETLDIALEISELQSSFRIPETFPM